MGTKDFGRQYSHPLTDSIKAIPWLTALAAKNRGDDRKIPAFWKTPDYITEKSVLCKTKQKMLFFSQKQNKTAFRSAAVVNIATELRTASTQAQGAGSRAVHSSVHMETFIRDKRRPCPGQKWISPFRRFCVFSTAEKAAKDPRPQEKTIIIVFRN